MTRQNSDGAIRRRSGRKIQQRTDRTQPLAIIPSGHHNDLDKIPSEPSRGTRRLSVDTLTAVDQFKTPNPRRRQHQQIVALKLTPFDLSHLPPMTTGDALESPKTFYGTDNASEQVSNCCGSLSRSQVAWSPSLETPKRSIESSDSVMTRLRKHDSMQFLSPSFESPSVASAEFAAARRRLCTEPVVRTRCVSDSDIFSDNLIGISSICNSSVTQRQARSANVTPAASIPSKIYSFSRNYGRRISEPLFNSPQPTLTPQIRKSCDSKFNQNRGFETCLSSRTNLHQSDFQKLLLDKDTPKMRPEKRQRLVLEDLKCSDGFENTPKLSSSQKTHSSKKSLNTAIHSFSSSPTNIVFSDDGHFPSPQPSINNESRQLSLRDDKLLPGSTSSLSIPPTSPDIISQIPFRDKLTDASKTLDNDEITRFETIHSPTYGLSLKYSQFKTLSENTPENPNSTFDPRETYANESDETETPTDDYSMQLADRSQLRRQFTATDSIKTPSKTPPFVPDANLCSSRTIDSPVSLTYNIL